MAFPTIPTVAGSKLLVVTNTAGGATKTFPSLTTLDNDAGDLLIAICVIFDGNSTNAEFSSWGGGFTELPTGGDRSTTTDVSIGTAYKFSDGTETGTFTVTTADASTSDSVMFLMAIPGAHPSTPPEAGGFASGTATAASPIDMNPSWGSADNLWIAVAGVGETSTSGSFTGIGSTPPTNYSGMLESGITADVVGGIEAAVAFRQNANSGENAGNFDNDTSNAKWSALTICVRPAPANLAIAAAHDLGMGIVTSLTPYHFDDDFPGAALQDFWTTQTGTPTVATGLLNLDIDLVEGIVTRTTRDLTNNALSWRNDTWPGSTGAPYVYCSCYIDSSHYVSFVIYDTAITAAKDTGSGFAALATTAIDTTAQRWMRIKETGGTTYWQYSADGTSWTTLYSEANPITMTALALSFETGVPDGTPITDWKIDRITFKPAGVPEHALAAAHNLAPTIDTALKRETFIAAAHNLAPVLDSALTRQLFVSLAHDLGLTIVTNLTDLGAEFFISAAHNLAPTIDTSLNRTTFVASAHNLAPSIDSGLIRTTFVASAHNLNLGIVTTLLRETFIAAAQAHGPQIDSALTRTLALAAALNISPDIVSALVRTTFIAAAQTHGPGIATALSRETFIALAEAFGPTIAVNLTVEGGAGVEHFISAVMALGPQIDAAATRTTFVSSAHNLDAQIASALTRTTFLAAAHNLNAQIAAALTRETFIVSAVPLTYTIDVALTRQLFAGVSNDLALQIASRLVMELFAEVDFPLGSDVYINLTIEGEAAPTMTLLGVGK